MRAEWAAASAKQRDVITSLPVPFVILHHTYVPQACNSSENCEAAMRAMQHVHQDERGWFDIGYK
jgi:N-acetylmuramoyl-L-alanine amidase